MVDRIPNLFLVGAMRSGTTALHEVLGTHPDIFMSPVKEPAFFTDPTELATDSRVAAEAGYAANSTAYLELFRAAGTVRYAGESSTHYTKQPRITGVAARMAEMTPHPHILYLVRDPVRRTLSHYRYHVAAKYERLPCLEALQTDPAYCATSDYTMQIRPFIERFGEPCVRVVVLEELVGDAAATLTSLYEWLDVDPAAGAMALPQRNEVGGEIARARGPEMLHSIGRSSTYQRMARAILSASLRARVRSILNQPVATDETKSPEVLDYLRRVHTPHVVALEDMLGRQMELWTTTRPAGGVA